MGKQGVDIEGQGLRSILQAVKTSAAVMGMSAQVESATEPRSQNVARVPQWSGSRIAFRLREMRVGIEKTDVE